MEKEVVLTALTDLSQLELLKKQLDNEGYEVVVAADVSQLKDVIARESDIALAVVDVSSFDESIWSQMEELSKSGIPFYVISPEQGPAAQKEILKHGASGLFSRGLRIKELLQYVHALLSR